MSFNDYFKSIPVLETDRLRLRQFTEHDISDYLAIIRDASVRQYLGEGVNDLASDRDISNWLRNINDRLLRSKTVFTWCVEHKGSGQIMGRMDLGGFVQKSMADLSYYFSKDFWNMGFATEAVREVVRFGLNDLKLHRIQAMVMPDNLASIRVLKKAGFEEEGLLRKYHFGKEFHDTVIMSKISENNLSAADNGNRKKG